MIEINNLTFFAVDKKFFTGVAKNVLKGENKGKKNLSVAFVPADEIKKLNKKYRRKNKATDVLTFSYKPKIQIKNKKILKEELFGEAVICPEVVKENAKKYNTPLSNGFKKELARVLIHGILHLLGYDHEKTEKEKTKMEKKEEHYLSIII